MATQRLSKVLTVLIVFTYQLVSICAYDASRTDNIVAYYGQNSIGVSNSNQAVWQKSLSTYCQDDTINVFPLAFLNVFFSAGGLPEINLANTCSSNSGVFAGTNLANCQFMAADIQACQAKGKIITLSLGGATGAAALTSDAQAQQFANTIWNVFLGGSSSTRPFGSAVLDGVDLDIEGGSSTYFATFINTLKSLSSSASKKYYYTAAPQCPYPDAYLGTVLNAVGFDAVYVQFYNNYCSLPNYGNANAWNFASWDTWAKTVSPNKNVKIFIGAPASSSAATSGYVAAGTLASIATQTRSQYSSFGGVMFWDVSQIFGNGRIDQTVKAALSGGGGGTTTPPTTTTTTTTKSTTTTSTTTPPSSGSCAGVAAWSSSVAYNGGAQITYNGHLWTAKWWTQADVPGGAAGVWTDNGVCKAKEVPTQAVSSTFTGIASTTPLLQSTTPTKPSSVKIPSVTSTKISASFDMQPSTSEARSQGQQKTGSQAAPTASAVRRSPKFKRDI